LLIAGIINVVRYSTLSSEPTHYLTDINLLTSVKSSCKADFASSKHKSITEIKTLRF